MTLVITSGSVELKALEVLDDSLGKCNTARLVLALAPTFRMRRVKPTSCSLPSSWNAKWQVAPSHLRAGAEAVQLHRQLAKMEFIRSPTIRAFYLAVQNPLFSLETWDTDADFEQRSYQARKLHLLEKASACPYNPLYNMPALGLRMILFPHELGNNMT